MGTESGSMRVVGPSRPWVVLVTAVVLLVCACTAPEGNPPAQPSELPAGSAEALPPAAALDAIASAGIRIVAADGSTAAPAAAPATGVEMTEEQVSHLLGEAEAGSGTLGADLDAIARAELPLSALLAGYARGVDTPAARLAKQLLGTQDLVHPDRVVFPALVLTLFASDAAHAVGDPELVSLALSSHTDGGLCSDVTAAIYRGIDAIFNALHVDYLNLPKTGVAFIDGLLQGLANLVVDGINIVVEAGRVLVMGFARFVIDEVLKIVAKVAALAAMIGQFSMFVSPIRVRVEFEPPTATKGTASAPVRVKATATAVTDIGGSGERGDWPAWFVNCAAKAGVTLKPLKPLHEPATWTIITPEPGLLSGEPGGKRDDEMQEGGTGTVVASWALVTGTEPDDLKGELVTSAASVHIKIKRTQVEALIKSLGPLATEVIAGELPEFMKTYLTAAITLATGELAKGFADLMSPTGLGRLQVSYHDADTKPPGGGREEVWDGTFTSNVYPISGTFVLDITRTPETFAGSLVVTGSDCLQGGQLRAEVFGDRVEFGLVVGGRDAVTFTGTLVGRRMSGRFSSGPDCGNDKGSWEATLR